MSDFTEVPDIGMQHKDGWAIKFEGRGSCIYSEGGKTVSFEYELNDEDDTFYFAPFNKAQWDSEESMPAKKWQEIIKRLELFLNWDDDWKPFKVSIQPPAAEPDETEDE